ncbi:MAG TPA: PAS domain S-box protein, partial [Nitrospinota bacterium]|nr:PAS domain S-box protein [Nitrospinota bacterium]
MKTLETELYQKTKLPQMNEKWFLVTLNSIGDAVIATDTKGCVTFMNPIAQNLTGWNQEDALGGPLKNIFNIINEETGKRVENPFSKVLREGNIVGLANHTLLISKNGMKIPIDNNGAPIKDYKGDIIGVVLVFRNITERKLMETILKESRERFKDLYENAPDGYYSLDGNGIVIEANNTFLEMFGYKKEELKRKHTSILFSEKSKDNLNQFFSRLKEEGIIDQEVKFVKKDGKELYVRFRGIAKHDENKYLEYKCTIRDITERKKVDEKLKILYEVGKKITSIISKEELLPWIAKQAARLLEADECVYRIREGDYLLRGGGTKEGMELMKTEKLKIGE